MEELEKARLELEAVRRGDMKANNACEMVNNWLKLSVYDVAWSVAQYATKREREAALDKVEEQMPDFLDDVKTVAKIIYEAKK